MLPPRTIVEEQRFLLELQQENSQETIQQAITLAIEQRRPQLAGQLFVLLQEIIPLDPILQKANKALRFSILDGQQWLQIEEAWQDFAPSSRIQRMKGRHRDNNDLRNRPWKRR